MFVVIILFCFLFLVCPILFLVCPILFLFLLLCYFVLFYFCLVWEVAGEVAGEKKQVRMLIFFCPGFSGNLLCKVFLRLSSLVVQQNNNNNNNNNQATTTT
jgi:hypothetical protein